jgi:hypothetical protein
LPTLRLYSRFFAGFLAAVRTPKNCPRTDSPRLTMRLAIRFFGLTLRAPRQIPLPARALPTDAFFEFASPHPSALFFWSHLRKKPHIILTLNRIATPRNSAVVPR